MSVAANIRHYAEAGIRRRGGKPLHVQLGLYVSAAFSLLILLSPVIWIVSTAIKKPEHVFVIPPMLIPPEISLDGILGAFNPDIFQFFINSVVTGAGAALLATFAGALTAYGIARLRFRGRNLVMLFFLASLAFPLPMMMITMYGMFAASGLLNTYPALILSHTVLTLPIVVWLMKDFFETLPVELEEAAVVDGAGPFYIIFRVIFPLLKPPMAAAAIFVFVTSWNEFIFGLTFVSSVNMRPLPAGISMLYLQEFNYNWPELMGIIIVVTLPVLAMFLFFQRYFVAGVTAGAVKG
ncbi:MAG: carbohydrate ABC transporter permease [Pseudomonadota bacterium]